MTDTSTAHPSPPFTDPVKALLAIGKIKIGRPWDNYAKEYGLSIADIPELARLAAYVPSINESKDMGPLYASIHAWRALGQLHAEQAIEPLIGLLRRIDEDDDDWAGEELPVVFGMIGGAAVDPLASYLANRTNLLFARVAASVALGKIGVKHPDQRSKTVGLLGQALANGAGDDPTLNGFLVSALLDLHAVEQQVTLRDAFAANIIDESIAGNWNAVQLELGLKARPIVLNPRQRHIFERAIKGIGRPPKND